MDHPIITPSATDLKIRRLSMRIDALEGKAQAPLSEAEQKQRYKVPLSETPEYLALHTKINGQALEYGIWRIATDLLDLIRSRDK